MRVVIHFPPALDSVLSTPGCDDSRLGLSFYFSIRHHGRAKLYYSQGRNISSLSSVQVSFNFPQQKFPYGLENDEMFS